MCAAVRFGGPSGCAGCVNHANANSQADAISQRCLGDESFSALNQSRSVQRDVGAFVLSAVVAAALMEGARLPITGAVSLGKLAGLCAAGGAEFVCAASFLCEMQRGRGERRTSLSWQQSRR